MRHIFVTGATGAIGSALIPRLLTNEDTVVTVLIRASSLDEARRRLDTLHRYWQYGEQSSARGRVRVLLGDISAPRFGLDTTQWSELAQSLTQLIHCAASVKLNMPMELARSTAVIPTHTALDLAEMAAAHKLTKVDIVSTVGVWGCVTGTMPERQLSEVSEFHNTYEAAKAEAERTIWDRGAALPITVHRPSMVVGRTGDGQIIHFQIFYHLCEFLSGRRTFGVMPVLGHTRLDTVPVDWVANAIAWSSENPQSVGRILHLCSGPDLALPVVELQRMVRELWPTAGRSVPRLWRMNRKSLERLIPLFGALGGQRARRALRGLPPVLAYLAEDQSFGNSQSGSLLAAAGLPVPPPKQYLGDVMRFYLDRDER